MGGVGPGLGEVAFDFSKVTPVGKMIAFFCMYVGRMEIMPVMLLFLPNLWRE
jgi:trk system potassium uptake protein TrkH